MMMFLEPNVYFPGDKLSRNWICSYAVQEHWGPGTRSEPKSTGQELYFHIVEVN